MPEEPQLKLGKSLLAEITQGCADHHGLRPVTLEWVACGFEWMLKVVDVEHTVRVALSADQIAMFAEDSPENRPTNLKIRNVFAGLSM